ncbi:MAG: hypothetical protein P8P83_05705 [Rickettsiaceae bacterium]|nr:hypothetical protein [Rickettsiaceae bacterium]
MKKNFFVTLTTVVLALGFTAPAKADLPIDNIIRGTLQNIDTSVTVAVLTAEQTYLQQAGLPLPQKISLSDDHPYFQHFKINTTYAIEMMFDSSQKTKVDVNAGIEGDAKTTPGLFNKKILLVPVYTDGDAIITAWECLTDADSYFSVLIQGATPASDGDRSFITRYSDNPYLALCTYVSSANSLFSVP